QVALSDGQEVGAVMDENHSLGSNVTIAVRPEKMSILPTDGTLKTDEGMEVSAAETIERLKTQPQTVILPCKIKHSIYIGTDMRHIVSLGDTGQDIVVRMQNYGRRFDQQYEDGQDVYVHWVDE